MKWLVLNLLKNVLFLTVKVQVEHISTGSFPEPSLEKTWML